VDNPTLTPEEKQQQLQAIRDVFMGDFSAPEEMPARRLMELLLEHEISPHYVLQFLQAMEQDTRKNRYQTWSEVITYAQFSTATLGRFMLAVEKEEDAALYRACDACLIALQVLDFVVDVRRDYTELNRIYLPQTWMEEAGVEEAMLARVSCTPEIRQLLNRVLAKAQELLNDGAPLARKVKNPRFAFEIRYWWHCCARLLRKLQQRDPLAGHIRLSRWDKSIAAFHAWRKKP
jgi:phytoene/squalene synthetase